jgi:gamma-glutamyltranspeptidase/glutathione hydrolase
VALVALSMLVSVPLARAAGTAAIATPERHATEVAIDVLERGGNAIDAAVAVGFVLAVTMPDAGNIGGGGFMTLYVGGEPAFLDYRETASAQASRDMYLDAQGELIDGASLTGHRAVGTPGTVAGLWAAHERYGRLPWASLLETAIELAMEGFVPEQWLVDLVDSESERLQATNFADYYGRMRAESVSVSQSLPAH